MNRAVVAAAALAYAGLLPSLVHAENAVLSWSTASVDNLVASVSDLRPQDGQQASLTYLSGNTTLVATEIYADRTYPATDSAARTNYQASVFNPLALDVKTPGQQASSLINATELRSRVQLTSDAFDGPVIATPFFDPTVPGTIGPGRSARARSEGRFSLAAGSEVVFTGTIHLGTALNLDALAGMAWLSELGAGKSVLATSQARGELELTLLSLYDQVEVIAEGPSSKQTTCCNRIITATNTTEQYLGPWGVSESSSLPGQTDQSFRYVVRNLGDTAIAFAMSVNTRSTFGANLTAVPEASTWVLSLVGLLAMMPIWVRRRA